MSIRWTIQTAVAVWTVIVSHPHGMIENQVGTTAGELGITEQE